MLFFDVLCTLLVACLLAKFRGKVFGMRMELLWESYGTFDACCFPLGWE